MSTKAPDSNLAHVKGDDNDDDNDNDMIVDSFGIRISIKDLVDVASEDDSDCYSFSDDGISVSNYVLERKEEDGQPRDDWVVVQDEKIEGLRGDAAATWPSLSAEEKCKKRYVMAALQSPTLPPTMEDFECTILDELRLKDRDVVLAYIRHPDYTTRSSDVNSIPRNFQDDVELVLEACRKSPFALSHASHRIRSNINVVTAAVMAHGDGGSGGQMKYASEHIRTTNGDLWRIAIRYNIREFLDVPESSKAMKIVGDDQDIIFRVITEIDGKYLDRASPRIYRNKDMVIMALKNSSYNHAFIKNVHPQTLSFLQQAIVAEPMVFTLDIVHGVKHWPPSQVDELAALAIANYKTRMDLTKIINCIQNPADKAVVLSALLDREEFRQFRDPSFCSSEALMFEAVKDNGISMMFIGPELYNESFLLRCIEAGEYIDCRTLNFRYLRTEMKRNKAIAFHVIRNVRTLADVHIVWGAMDNIWSCFSDDRDIMEEYRRHQSSWPRG